MTGTRMNKTLYTRYEFKLLNKSDKKKYVAWGTGKTIREALRDSNFFKAPGQRIGELFKLIDVKVENMTDEYPYKMRDMLKRAFADKAETIRKIERYVTNKWDKADLKAVVENEAAWDFCRLDTICRDKLFELMDGSKMKFFREDVYFSLNKLNPIDKRDPKSASTAIELSLPTGFSDKAKACWNYYDGTAFLFEYKNQLVVTDESLWLTDFGDGTWESPLGFPRWVCDSWEELEKILEQNYDELKEDEMI